MDTAYDVIDPLQAYCPTETDEGQEAIHDFSVAALQYGRAVNELGRALREDGVGAALEPYQEAERYDDRLSETYTALTEMGMDDDHPFPFEASVDALDIIQELDEQWYDAMREGTVGSMTTHDLRDLLDRELALRGQ